MAKGFLKSSPRSSHYLFARSRKKVSESLPAPTSSSDRFFPHVRTFIRCRIFIRIKRIECTGCCGITSISTLQTFKSLLVAEVDNSSTQLQHALSQVVSFSCGSISLGFLILTPTHFYVGLIYLFIFNLSFKSKSGV